MGNPPALPGQEIDDVIAGILRVDHAGEVGAVAIYDGQGAMAPDDDAFKAKVYEMGQQEREHLRAFDALLRERGVRPSALLPLWHVFGFFTGAASSLASKRIAMACTIAVEETIEEHYAGQIALLRKYSGTEELVEKLEKFLAEETQHKEEARAHNGEQAPFYGAIKNCVQTGCRLAIQIAQII